MKINKVRNIVRKKLIIYSVIDTMIENLENKKETNNGKDINSSIKSRNKISNIVEAQVIKNISIDNQIAELKKWKEVINFVFEEIAEDNVKLEAMQYKYLCKLPEFTILEMLPIARGTLRNYINEFVMEICLIATEEKLIK